jgi:mitochondrial chaperone BCS1
MLLSTETGRKIMRIKGTFWFLTIYCVFSIFFYISRILTLSGLLNILDGLGAGEGHILVATTNYYGRLDEALTRPGRIDLEVKFELATKHQAREQFRQFYVPQIISKEKELGTALSKTKSQSSSDQGKNGPPPAENYFQDKDHLDDSELTTRFGPLADQFVEDFPEYVISSASLQQYLLMYKSGPIEAVANFKAWVQAEVDKKERKQNKAKNSELVLAERQGHSPGTILDDSSLSVQFSDTVSIEGKAD